MVAKGICGNGERRMVMVPKACGVDFLRFGFALTLSLCLLVCCPLNPFWLVPLLFVQSALFSSFLSRLWFFTQSLGVGVVGFFTRFQVGTG